MAHQLRVEPKGTHLHARVTGDNSLQDVEGYLSEVREACVAQGCSRLLVEENLLGPSLGALPIFDLVSRRSEPAAGIIRSLSYVDANRAHEQPEMKFAETVAVNRGLNVRVFSSVDAAEQWLLSQEHDGSG